MKRQELAQHDRLAPQKLSARETPHATIEPNTTCNIRCAYCYCIEEAAIKTLAEVKADIDLAMSLRNLDTISLLGGEPTLHPDILEIVRYVKSKGVVCMLLTNGVAFVRDHDEALLDGLIEAGVDRFLVHIDSGQKHVHGDIDAARHRMFDMLDGRSVNYGLSITLYRGQEHELVRVVREFARHRWFDGILCTLAFDLPHAFDPKPNPLAPRPEMSAVYRAIQEGLGIEPAAYLPSSTDDDEVAWLMYFYFMSVETGATLAISPELNRATKRLFRRLKGHHFFAETMKPSNVASTLAAAALAEAAMRPSLARAREVAKLLRHPKDLRFHYIVVQQAPMFDAERGKVQICWQCPDATIRNGELTPVCIAGRVSPLGGRPVTAPPEVVTAIREHLRG
jgi:pyruvate-formate lyase-activating enzyme